MMKSMLSSGHADLRRLSQEWQGCGAETCKNMSTHKGLCGQQQNRERAPVRRGGSMSGTAGSAAEGAGGCVDAARAAMGTAPAAGLIAGTPGEGAAACRTMVAT